MKLVQPLLRDLERPQQTLEMIVLQDGHMRLAARGKVTQGIDPIEAAQQPMLAQHVELFLIRWAHCISSLESPRGSNQVAGSTKASGGATQFAPNPRDMH